MNADINAAPDYCDEPPFACSSVAVLDGQRFACGGTPGHAGKHSYLIWWDGQGDIAAKPEPQRYALVEQMGRRSTTATVREVAFLGRPALEVTDLKTGSVHVVFPDSLYEVTWLTEDDAHARAKPWTAVALPAANPDPWGPDSLAEDDRGDWADDGPADLDDGPRKGGGL